MDKMISVINENLNSIINGVVTHRKDTEKALSVIESDISEKIAVANSYKESVAQSQTIITNLENEISALEKDLEELTNKFNEKDFKEIIAAGNKEINGKIIEKRAQIQEQTSNIVDLTEKAQHLKDELIKLNEKKDATAENLKNSYILEKYYSNRINSIIEYSVEHKNELDNYVEIKDADNLVESVEIDKEELVTPVDDSIFNEIDSLATNDIDEDMLESVLSDESQVEVEENTSDEKEIKDFSVEEQLDNIISSATDIIEKTNKVTEEIEQSKLPKIELISEPEDIVVENINNLDEIKEQLTDEKQDNELTDEEFNKKIDEELNNIEIEYKNRINELDFKYNKDEFSDPDDEGGITINFSEFDSKNNENESDELNITNQMAYEIEPKKDINEEINECGLDTNSFEEFELQKFKSNFNLDNTKKFIEILNKHNIDKSVIYDSVDVINEVTPQNLDIMLSQLEKLSIETDDIKYIFKYLNKINMSKLENSIKKDKNRELTEVLIDAIDLEQNINLKELFNLDNDDLKKLKSSSIGNDYKIINTFPELVLENYNTLKALRIDNLTECFIKYPHRFILNPSNFKSILDKYDTEDLIRCINKNSAVINRL